MFWALMAWYFLGGSTVASGSVLTSAGVADLEERVAILVEDPIRQQSAARTLKDLRASVKSFEKTFAKSGKQLKRLYVDHADNRDEALAIFDDLNSEWEAGQKRALDARFALRDQLTEDAWQALFGEKK